MRFFSYIPNLKSTLLCLFNKIPATSMEANYVLYLRLLKQTSDILLLSTIFYYVVTSYILVY